MKRFGVTVLRTESMVMIDAARSEPVALTHFGDPYLVVLDYTTYMVMKKKLEDLDATVGNRPEREEARPDPDEKEG